MKKIFSLILCLLLCVTPCFILSACGERKLDETEAATRMQTAIANMQTQTAYQLTMDMGVMSMTIAVTEDAQYSKMNMVGMLAETWIETEDLVDYDYTMTTIEMEGETEGETETFVTYTKSVSEGLDMDLSDLDEQMPEDVTFVSATNKKGVVTIVYSTVQDGKTVKVTYVIENDLFTSMSMTSEAGVVVAAATIKYGSAVVVPTKPTEDAEGQPIVWVEDME